MLFKKINHRFIAIKKNNKKIGHSIRSYFISEKGLKIMLTSNVLELKDTKSEKIKQKTKIGLFSYKSTYSDEFIEELLEKNNNFLKIKTLRVKSN